MGKLNTKEKILNAAREEFLQRGFDAARMRTIAERADINKGLLHYYFKSKETLLIEVFQDTFKEIFTSLETLFLSDQSLQDKIEQVVDEYITFLMKRPRLPFFIISEFNRNTKRHQRHLQQAAIRPPFHLLVASIEEAKKSGEVREDLDPRHFVLNLISLSLFPFLAKHMIMYMHEADEATYKQLIEQRKKEVSDLMIRSLEPRKAS